MALAVVDAVEVRCDGCGERMESGDEYCFWLRDQVDEWLGECGWREEEGKHFCCTESAKYKPEVCWPPSMREGEPDA